MLRVGGVAKRNGRTRMPGPDFAGIGERVGAGRLAHIDSLKAIMVAWIIGGHALLGYAAVGGWPYDEVNEVTFAPRSELVLSALLGPSALFVIGTFFFVAG